MIKGQLYMFNNLDLYKLYLTWLFASGNLIFMRCSYLFWLNTEV